MEAIMNLFSFIEDVSLNTSVIIRGTCYRVLAMVKYVTEQDPEHWYVKLKLDKNSVLVISPFDNYMYLGFVGEPFSCDFPTPEIITHNDVDYKLETTDYQIVKEFVFGNILEMEGEVLFSDYSAGDRIISMGIISRTNTRADVYAEVLHPNDIKLANE